MATLAIPRAFVWRRLHSLMGLWFVLFLMEHLLANSQAALWLGDNGRGFVDMVNGIHNLPYLQAIEVTLLGVPIFIHVVWGVKYLFTAKFVSQRSDGSSPQLRLPRNRAYKWQRITSWILLIGLIGHVAKFRFLEYPDAVHVGNQTHYLVTVDVDEGIYTVADRLGATLYDSEAVAKAKTALDMRHSERALVEAAETLKKQTFDPLRGIAPEHYDPQKALILSAAQNYESEVIWVDALEKQRIGEDQVLAVCKDFGTASLLAVRNTFKSPLYIALYTIFVLAACFHALNGVWTFLITWGWVLKMSAQRAWVTVCTGVMLLLIFLGLAAVWGTYWMNLRY